MRKSILPEQKLNKNKWLETSTYMNSGMQISLHRLNQDKRPKRAGPFDVVIVKLSDQWMKSETLANETQMELRKHTKKLQARWERHQR